MSHRRGYCLPMGHATTLLLASHSRAQATYVLSAPPRETCASDRRYGAQVLNRPSLPIPLPHTPKNMRFFTPQSRASDRRMDGNSGVCCLGRQRSRPGADGLLYDGMMHGAGRGMRLSVNVGCSARRHAASLKRCHATAVQKGGLGGFLKGAWIRFNTNTTFAE